MAELKEKYGFPFFTRLASVVYHGHERKLIISDICAFWDYELFYGVRISVNSTINMKDLLSRFVGVHRAYWTIFYLASITRYRPNLFDEIFGDTEQWLMSEFLSTQPRQFLYLATAKMLVQKVLKAYSKFEMFNS